MNESSRIQRRWAWLMGAITLVVALFFPPLWTRVEGFFWQLRGLSPASSLLQVILQTNYLDWLILFFPPCALTACIIWLWTRQMNWHPTIIRGMLVTFEATVLALLMTAVFFAVVFVIPAPGNGWGMAFAIFNTMWTGLSFLAFFPCLLITAIVLAHFQKTDRIVSDNTKSGA